MKKRLEILFFLAVFVSCIGFSLAATICSPADYNLSASPTVCDYGVNLGGLNVTYLTFGGTDSRTSDGLYTSSSGATPNTNITYTKQQETANCLFALSSNSWDSLKTNCDYWVHLPGGMSNFTINGQNCYVVEAAHAYNPSGDGNCNIVQKAGDVNTLPNNVHYSGWLLNITCNGVNKKYTWKTGQTSFNNITRDYSWQAYKGNGAMFAYNRTQFANNVCPACYSCNTSVSHFLEDEAASSISIPPIGAPFNTTYHVSQIIINWTKAEPYAGVCNLSVQTSGLTQNVVNNTTSPWGLATFSYNPVLDFPINNFSLGVTPVSNCPDIYIMGYNVSGMCGIGCFNYCYQDADGDGYAAGAPVKTLAACSSLGAGWYDSNSAHWIYGLGQYDCDDNNSNAWQNVDNLGIDMDSDGFISNFSSCQTRCVGNESLTMGSSYTSDGTNYIYSYCDPSELVDCNDTVYSLTNSCGNLSGTLWTDLEGNAISSADFGDTVEMVAQSGNLNFSQNNVSYTILKNATFLWWTYGVVLSPTSSLSYWLANSSGNNYYFNSSLTSSGTAYSSLSNYLNVSSVVNDFMPVANITLPAQNMFFEAGNSILFNQSSYDQDDLLNLYWDFGDGTNTTIYNYSYINQAQGNVQHTYLNSGVYTAALTASEVSRSQSTSANVKLYAVQPGINVFPVITMPSLGAILGSGPVVLNASQTFVVNCSAGVIQSFAFKTNDGALNCSYIKAPGTNLNQNLTGYSLLFNWTMTDGNDINSKSGYWTDSSYYGENGVVEFLYNFENPGIHNIGLTVRYSN